MEKFRIVVLAKQVPDTRNVGQDAMKPDGTVNRGALPAIFNPEDMLALEQALRIKSAMPEAHVTVLTMGPPRATEILREGLFRGADDGVLLTDRAFAGSDTLATSYALACALRKLNPHLILAGRQAIDGDTAQVGPQVAQKMGWPQITYVEEILEIHPDSITARRRIDSGVEVVKGALPLLLTINGTAPQCRPRHAKRLMQWRRAVAPSEKAGEQGFETPAIQEWSAADLQAEPAELGLLGSPTKVKTIENVVFQVKEAKQFDSSPQSVETLVKELITNHTIG